MITAISIIGVIAFLIGIFSLGYYFGMTKKTEITPFPECKFKCDPNQCDTWCMAKERFTNNPPLDEM